MFKPISVSGPLVVRSPNWLGDAVMALPTVRNLKAHLGAIPLTVATPEKIAALWEACPFVDRVLPLTQPRDIFATARQLRTGSFRSAVLLPNSLRTAAEVFLAGIPQRIGYRTAGRRWLLTQALPPPFNPRAEHHSKYFLGLAQACGAPEITEFPPLICPPVPPGYAVGERSRPLLALCPGAEYGPAKRWPAVRFLQVTRELIARHHFTVVLLGARGDAPVANAIAEQLPEALNLVGRTTLREFMGWLGHAQLVLGNDSGAMHVASALGTPTVAIFGSTEPRWTGPMGPRSVVVRHHVPCSPCFLRDCPIDFSCMISIPPSEVLAVAEKMLA